MTSYRITPIILETLLIWCVSLVLSLPALLSQELVSVDISQWSGSGDREVKFVKCVESMERWQALAYAVVIFVAQYLVPVTVLCLSHYKIEHRLGSRLQQLMHSVAGRTADPIFLRDKKFLIREVARNKKVIRLLYHLVASFMMTWLSWTAVNIYIEFSNAEVDPHILVLFHLVAMSSIPLNAFLYGWSNSMLRSEGNRLWQLLQEGIRGRKTVSAVLSQIPLRRMPPERVH